MKAIKFIVKLLLWIVGIVVALVLTLPLWIGPVAKMAANAIVPKKTGTAFNLGQFALNPYTGKLSVGDVQLYNPEGFDQKMAATLGSFNVAVDVASLAGDPIVVRDIVLKDIFVSYVANGKGENNFAIIKKNAMGGDEKVKVESQEKVKVQDEGEQRRDSSFSQSSQTSQTKSSKKVIIDHLLIENVLVQLGPLSLPMPNIELTGIGRKDGGATMEEAWKQIYAQILQGFNSVGVNLDQLLGGLGNVKVDQVMKAIDAVKKLDGKDVSGAVNAGVSILNAATGKSLGNVGAGVGKTTDAVSGAATKTVDTATKSVDKTTEQLNKHIEKAAETINALKGLF